MDFVAAEAFRSDAFGEWLLRSPVRERPPTLVGQAHLAL
jgi:hypothetical protein